MADLNPWSKRAITLIDWHLNHLVDAERTRRMDERKRAQDAWQKYNDGMDTLCDLITNLKEIGGYGDE